MYGQTKHIIKTTEQRVEGGEQSIILLPHVCFAYVNRHTQKANQLCATMMQQNQFTIPQKTAIPTKRKVLRLSQKDLWQCASKSCRSHISVKWYTGDVSQNFFFTNFPECTQLQNQKNRVLSVLWLICNEIIGNLNYFTYVKKAGHFWRGLCDWKIVIYQTCQTIQ